MSIVYSLVARGKNVLAEYTSTSGNFPTVTRVLLGRIREENGRMSYVYDKYVFHCMVEDQLIYLCMTDENFIHRLPFLFLEDIKEQFISKYGEQAKTAIAFAMNHEFQHVLRKKMDYYNNNPSVDGISRVQQQLDGVKDVMMQNIEKVLERGEKIELLVDRTDKLNHQAFRFERKSRQLKNKLWWKNIKMWIVFGTLTIVILYFLVSYVCGFNFNNCLKE